MSDIARLQRALTAFLEEFMDEHEVPLASVVGTLHVVAFEVLRQNSDTELEDFNQGLN